MPLYTGAGSGSWPDRGGRASPFLARLQRWQLKGDRLRTERRLGTWFGFSGIYGGAGQRGSIGIRTIRHLDR